MNNKPNLIFISPSGGGKTTCCNYLVEHYNYYTYHPYFFRKRQYETLYRLPAYYLDTVEGKSDSAPGMTCTFQEMMMKDYHFWAEVDPLFCSRNTAIELLPVIERNQPICMQAIRNKAEVKEIQKLNIPYELVELTGRGKAETTDEHYDWIAETLNGHPLCKRFHTIDNSVSLCDLYNIIDLLVMEV